MENGRVGGRHEGVVEQDVCPDHHHQVNGHHHLSSCYHPDHHAAITQGRKETRGGGGDGRGEGQASKDVRKAGGKEGKRKRGREEKWERGRKRRRERGRKRPRKEGGPSAGEHAPSGEFPNPCLNSGMDLQHPILCVRVRVLVWEGGRVGGNRRK
jgi:hypothetical protein